MCFQWDGWKDVHLEYDQLACGLQITYVCSKPERATMNCYYIKFAHFLKGGRKVMLIIFLSKNLMYQWTKRIGVCHCPFFFLSSKNSSQFVFFVFFFYPSFPYFFAFWSRVTCHWVYFSHRLIFQEQAKKALESALGGKKIEFEKWNKEIQKREEAGGGGNSGGGGWFGGGRWFGGSNGDHFWQEAQQASLAILGIILAVSEPFPRKLKLPFAFMSFHWIIYPFLCSIFWSPRAT